MTAGADVFLGAAAASLSLADNLYTIIKNARERKQSLSGSTIVTIIIPGQILEILEKIESEAREFEQKCIELGVEMDKPLDQVPQMTKNFLHFRYNRFVTQAQNSLVTLANGLIAIEEDLYAAARCLGEDDFIVSCYEDARKNKIEMRNTVLDAELPLGSLLTFLIEETEKRSAAIRDALGAPA